MQRTGLGIFLRLVIGCDRLMSELIMQAPDDAQRSIGISGKIVHRLRMEFQKFIEALPFVDARHLFDQRHFEKHLIEAGRKGSRGLRSDCAMPASLRDRPGRCREVRNATEAACAVFPRERCCIPTPSRPRGTRVFVNTHAIAFCRFFVMRVVIESVLLQFLAFI